MCAAAQGLVKCKAVMGYTQLDGLLMQPVNKMFWAVCLEQEDEIFSSGNGTGEGHDKKVNCAGTNILVVGKGRRNRLENR